MSTDQPLILVTNDDGHFAPGLMALTEAMMDLGKVVVVAPDKAQSGMGHAITVEEPLFLKKLRDFPEEVEAWSCSGTPVDCVKIGRDIVLHRRPDLCVSGINHGSNASINVIYSGTMSAAMEGAIEGVPSIGFSLLDYRMSADFSASAKVANQLAKKALENGMPKGCTLNVNIPPLSWDKIKGIRMCRQAKAKWIEEFDERTDPRGRKYYWLTGRFESGEEVPHSDIRALEQNYVSVVPVKFDLTATETLSEFEHSWDIPMA